MTSRRPSPPLNDENRSDEVLIARLQNEEDALDETGLMHLAMQENYFRSVATFLYAVRMGRETDVADVIGGLTNGDRIGHGKKPLGSVEYMRDSKS